MARIYLNNMEFYAFHGCFPEEAIVGTYFSIDLNFVTSTEKAEKSDQIADTISYLDVYQKVKGEMLIPSKLVENLADRILQVLFREFPAMEELTIKIYKMNPPLGGKLDSVAVELTKKRV